MVVIDEKSRVAPLDASALEQLSHALDREGVVAAMLIGLQARGNPDLFRMWISEFGMTPGSTLAAASISSWILPVR